MASKEVKLLRVGDRLDLSEHGPGIVTRCVPSQIIEIAGDRAYEIEWRDQAGNDCHAIQGSTDLVAMSEEGLPTGESSA